MFKFNVNQLIAVTMAACVISAAASFASAQTGTKTSGQPGFGLQFVRDHPFTLGTSMTGGIDPWAGPDASFGDVGLNAVTTWPSVQAHNAAYLHQHGLSWVVEESDLSQLTPAQVNQYAQTPGGLGFMIWDEPSRQDMPAIAAKINEMRAAHPGYLYYSDALPDYATEYQLYGDGWSDPGVNYTYSQYLNDFNNMINPDVIMYNYYPFTKTQLLSPGYFSNLTAVRSVAQAANKPYWGWVQTFSQNTFRIPSESDVRMQAFSMLTAGYAGLSYYSWTSYGTRTGLVQLDSNNNPVPTVLYSTAKAMTPELKNLGRSLRFLHSTAVGFVPGQDSPGATHATPSGLTNFTPGAGGDPHIVSITVSDDGAAKDGLIGLFTDDSGQHYFMLTNLYHDASMTAAQAELSFQIIFDDQVNKILRLNRLTGEQEVLSLNNHTLDLTLPGGTGDLFKYDTGNFVVPEPSSLWLLVAAVGGLATMRRH